LNKDTKKYLNINKASFEENNIKKDIAIIRDTTEYNVLLKSIEQSAKNYISLVNAIPQGIYIYDFEDKKTTYVNEVLLNMSGFESLNEFNDSHIIKDISWVLNKFGQDVKFMRHKIQNRKGKYIDVELGGITLEINNKMKCIGIMNDISEKVRAEKLEKEVAKKKMEYKQKNHFFMNMSHELKTPLNLIMSTNQLIQSIFKNEIEKNPSSQISSTTKIVENQSYLSLQIIDNIMTLAKVDADFYRPEVGCYDIVSIVEDIITEINRYSKNNQIEFIFDTNMEEKLVYIDPYDIERIILLILSKVIKQSEAKSTVYVDFVDKDSEVEIFIKNKGGYNKDLSLENLSKENIQMNLEVASSIIKMYNGKIYIKENLNYLEIIIKMKLEENYNYEDKKESIINRESIYSQYSMINAL
ncbi:MAG: HAMP domain-containing sensor histidine kinase, partial [Peptostreptococcaceae bacterium]|nr:HAMP domain-containing sensor histidine kinase [Peptostreptococcaceae bacterium]